jgi:hypothetical protein
MLRMVFADNGWLLDLLYMKMFNEILVAYKENTVLLCHVHTAIAFITIDLCLQ